MGSSFSTNLKLLKHAQVELVLVLLHKKQEASKTTRRMTAIIIVTMTIGSIKLNSFEDWLLKYIHNI